MTKDLPQWAILLIRCVIMVLGGLVTGGKVPTGIEGLGPVLGPVLVGMGGLMAAGDKNVKP